MRLKQLTAGIFLVLPLVVLIHFPRPPLIIPPVEQQWFRRPFYHLLPLGSALTAEGMRGRDGSSEGIPNQFVRSDAEGLIAVCSMKKRERSGDGRGSCDRFTGGIWKSIPALGSHSHPERWPHTSHPSAGISTPTRLDPYRTYSLGSAGISRSPLPDERVSASGLVGQKRLLSSTMIKNVLGIN